MNILILLICMTICFLSFQMDRKLYNPFFIFNFIWGIAIFVSGFGFFDLWVASTNIYWLLLVAVLGFNLPLLLFYKKNKLLAADKSLVIEFSDSVVSNWTYNIIIIFQIVLLFISVKRTIVAFTWLSQGNTYERIRSFYYFSDSIVGSMTENLINLYIINPINMICMIFFSIGIYKKNVKLLFVILYLTNLSLQTFYTGARTDIFNLFILCIVSFLIFYQEIKKNRKKYIVLGCFAFIAVLIMIGITLVRSIHSSNALYSILKTITMYFTGSIKFLEISVDKYLGNQGFLWGRGFFGGIIDVFVLMLRFFGIRSVNTAGTLIGTPVQQAELIGLNQTYNAFTTMIYTFLFDFGIVGVFIESMLFGLLCAFSYYIMNRTKNIFICGMYLLCVIAIVHSILTWDFLSPWAWFTWIAFGILYLLDRRLASHKYRGIRLSSFKLSKKKLFNKAKHNSTL